MESTASEDSYSDSEATTLLDDSSATESYAHSDGSGGGRADFNIHCVL